MRPGRGAALAALAANFVAPVQPAATHAQSVQPSQGCRLRVSTLQSYAPFHPAARAAERVNQLSAAAAVVREPLIAFDRALATALADVPANDEAAFALTDVERVVEALDRCADSAGLSRTEIARSDAALAEAYRRNSASMRRPDFAERLLRSPRAGRALEQQGRGDVIDAAKGIKAGLDEERRAVRAAAAKVAAEREQLARAREAEARRKAYAHLDASEAIWHRNPSAPVSNRCDNYVTSEYRGRLRNAAWMSLLEQEIGKCERISSRRDANYYLGLALGTSVTDEQLVHAAGRAVFCLSNSESKRFFDGANKVMDQLYAGSGLGSTGFRAQPVWSEKQSGTRRLVQIRCDLNMSLFGLDFSGLQRSMADSLKADASSFVEYEIVADKLVAIRTHTVLTNQVKQETTSYSETYTCDPNQAQADAVASGFQSSGWRQLARLPWRYTMQNDALVAALVGPASSQTGNWFTFQRGMITVDLYNTRYVAPVLGQNGSCNGGAVDEFAMLASARASRVRPGTPITW